MKIKKDVFSNFIGYTIEVLLVCALYKFFFLFDNTTSDFINGAYGPSTKTIGLLSVIMILVAVVLPHKKKSPLFLMPIIVCELVIFFAAIITSNSFLDYFMSYIILILLYIALICWLDSEKKIITFCLLLQIAGVIVNVLLILQATIVNAGGDFFLHIYFVESGYWFVYRNGLLRITENEVLYLLVLCISVSKIKYKKDMNKFTYFVALVHVITTLINFMYVDQTRMIVTISIALIFFNLFLNDKMSKKIFIKRFILLLLLGIVIVFIWDSIISLLHFSLTEKSFVARVEGYKYFFDKGLSNPFWGLGFSHLYDNSSVNYTDVGIVGTFGQFGVILTISYIYIMVKMCKLTNKIKNSFHSNENNICINITAVIIFLSFTTMSMFNYGLLQVFAISLGIVESIYRCCYLSLQRY